MFKKKPNIKSLAPLRSSDRRRVTDQIIADYGIEIPKNEPAENQDEEQAGSGGIGLLRNSLLPEGALSARFSTTVGADLKTVNGTVYAGSHPDEEMRILWIKLDEKIIPSVYSLWHHPRLVPLLHTPDIVLQKMRGGADLMTPGLARGPPFPTRATKGAIVAIASYENPSVPLVVGECEIDVSALKEVRGAKGHAVKGLHWDGDEIWAWAQSGAAKGVPAPDHIEGWDVEAVDPVSDGVEALDLSKSEDEADEGGVAMPNGHGSRNEFVDGESIQSYEEVQVEHKEMSTKEIDDAFRNAFLFGAQTAAKGDRGDSKHGIAFPMPQSQFISDLILPYLPIFSPEDAASLQIKKTSWKNAKKFIKALEKQHLLKSKERNGGETVIMDIDFEDPAIVGLAPYRLPKKQQAVAENSGPSSSNADPSIGQKLKILNLLKPKEKIHSILEASQADPRAFYLPTEFRPVVTAYIEKEGLVPANKKSVVNIDPVLANAVFDSSSAVDKEVLAQGWSSRDALIRRVMESGCSSYHSILREPETREEAKPKAGNPPIIKMILETRSGNKTATRISGLEIFHIQPNMLAEELQKVCASSTSVSQLVGSSPKNPVMEIMVQGPQRDAVIKALEKRGVKKEWVEVVDKTKGKKKGTR